jgi:hypothetical protein
LAVPLEAHSGVAGRAEEGVDEVQLLWGEAQAAWWRGGWV